MMHAIACIRACVRGKRACVVYQTRTHMHRFEIVSALFKVGDEEYKKGDIYLILVYDSVIRLL